MHAHSWGNQQFSFVDIRVLFSPLLIFHCLSPSGDCWACGSNLLPPWSLISVWASVSATILLQMVHTMEWLGVVIKGPIFCPFSGPYFILKAYSRMLSCSKGTLIYWYRPLLQHLYSPSVWMLRFSACLFKAPIPKSPLFSDWSALTGLSRQQPLYFCICSAGFSQPQVTVWFLHHNLTEGLMALFKAQVLYTGSVYFSVALALYYYLDWC